MKIVVLVKIVPDTWGERVIDTETGLADRKPGELVMDEIGERALEAALKLADDRPGTEVVLLCMAPPAAETSIRKGLAMGATSAMHISDERLRGADLGVTAEVLSAAIRGMDADAVIAGNISTDGAGGVLPAMVAEHLALPHLTNLSAISWGQTGVRATRITEHGTCEVSAEYPMVISVTESFDQARFPNIRGIMSAKKKPYLVSDSGELGIEPVSQSRGRSIVLAVAKRTARASGITVVDEGDAGERLAEYLVNARLV
ncbi:MAG: electron transfer flavoprotein subunit beta/FixA family protein [Microbacteriaceae bacterium]